MRPENKESAIEREIPATRKALDMAGHAWKGNSHLVFENAGENMEVPQTSILKASAYTKGAGNPAKGIDWLDSLSQRSSGLKFCNLMQEHRTDFKDQCI